MRVKIGNTWYGPTVDTPMLVELNEKDKENIANMPKGMHRYGMFHDDTPLNVAERMAWMRDEESAPTSEVGQFRTTQQPSTKDEADQ